MPIDLYFVDFDSKPSNKLNLQSDCVGDLASKHKVAGILSHHQKFKAFRQYYYPPKVDNSEKKTILILLKGKASRTPRTMYTFLKAWK